MPLRIDYIKNEEGMTLIEVMAALVLLSLLAVTLLSVFSTSGSWISGAGKKTIAVQYANSIMDTIRANSLQLLDIPAGGDYTNISNESNDGFELPFIKDNDGNLLLVPAPANTLKATATINISPYDDNSYYPDDDNDGNPDIDLPFGGNLFDVKVKIEWEESGYSRDIEIFTIMGAQ